VAGVAVLRAGPDPLVGDRQALLTDAAQGRIDEHGEIRRQQLGGEPLEMPLDRMTS
jgi:hypothetical protein